MRLIDADELIERAYRERLDSRELIAQMIESAPTVEPKHGHWANKGFEPVRCSVCGITVDAINGIPWAIKGFKFCPHCGAKMDEVEDGKNG